MEEKPALDPATQQWLRQAQEVSNELTPEEGVEPAEDDAPGAIYSAAERDLLRSKNL